MLIKYVESQKGGKGCQALFIDEIQDIKGFESALRSFAATGKYDIYCTGSNAAMFASEVAHHLSGRYIERKIFGLSYAEHLQFHGLKDSNDSFIRYVRYGGLPYLINLPKDDERVLYDYLKNMYATILFKDIVARHRIRDVAFLERLVLYVADNIGNLVSAKKISDFLKSQKTGISPVVVLNYLSYLCSAFFLFKVPRIDIKGKKIFEVNEKYYFEDLGLRHSLVGYNANDIEKVLENIVYLHLCIAGYDVYVGQGRNYEIDFVALRGGERIYIQVAYQIPDDSTRDREFGNLLKIDDNFPKIVVSMDEAVGGTYKGVQHLHVRKFLLSLR